jgi:hypothetical protein
MSLLVGIGAWVLGGLLLTIVRLCRLLMNASSDESNPISRLHQSVDARLAVFRKLLRLSGRLDLLLTQVMRVSLSLSLSLSVCLSFSLSRVCVRAC